MILVGKDENVVLDVHFLLGQRAEVLRAESLAAFSLSALYFPRDAHH
jgi:hypothetical protein